MNEENQFKQVKGFNELKKFGKSVDNTLYLQEGVYCIYPPFTDNSHVIIDKKRLKFNKYEE